MKLEKFEINDFDQLYELLKNAFGIQVEKFACKNKLLKIMDNDHYQIYVVKESELVLGASIVNIHDDPFDKADFATLWYYAVLKEYQGKGIGTYMLNEISKVLKENGYLELRLTTSPTNIACQKSSEKAGFEKKISYKKILNE